MPSQTFPCAPFPMTSLAQIPPTDISRRAERILLCNGVRPGFKPGFFLTGSCDDLASSRSVDAHTPAIRSRDF